MRPSRLRKNTVFGRRCGELLHLVRALVAARALLEEACAWILRGLRCRGRLRAWLRHHPHQLGQPDEVVGSGSQGEHPADAGEATVMGLAKASSRLGPAKHLLNALAHPPTDRIARVAGRSTIDADRRLVVFCATCGVTLYSRRS